MKKAIPALAALVGMIGDRQVRHMGTIGGSLANNDPAADYPAAVLGLGATITTNKRKIAADKFFKGLYETALEARRDDHLGFLPGAQARRLREVPEPGIALCPRRGVRRRLRRHRRASASPAPARAPSARPRWRKALTAKFAPESVADIKVKDDGLNNDLHARPSIARTWSPSWRGGQWRRQ